MRIELKALEMGGKYYKYKGLCAQQSLTLFSSPGAGKCISSRGSMFPDVEAGLGVPTPRPFSAVGHALPASHNTFSM